MPSRTSIVRSRRARRKDQQQARRSRGLMGGIGLGILLSILTAILILLAALAYADLTRDLPNVALLPSLLNPPDGLLLHPTRVYDRTGTHMLFEFEPASSAGDVRRYIPISAAAPQHLPDVLVKSTVVLAEPGFWTGGGYTLAGLNDPQSHPTVAQKLASDLLLYSEPHSLRRALRERLLAAQLISEYGRSQVLEWYLNSADYGNDAYGVDSAARLYFGKPATDLTPGESAVLAAVSQAPDLNPLDASDMARERGRTAIGLLKTFKLITADEASAAIASLPASATRPTPGGRQSASLPLFRSLLLHQLDARYTGQRVRRGGLVILTTLDYDLQRSLSQRMQAQEFGIAVPGSAPSAGASASVNGQAIGPTPAPAGPSYGEGGVVSLDPNSAPGVLSASAGPSASALVLDPRSGEILAAVGETLGGQETSLLSPHDPGTLLAPFTYLTAFTRGFGPGSMVWDIPSADAPVPAGAIPAAGSFHGPIRMRVALANDYAAAANAIAAQMGADAISRTRQSFGLTLRNQQATLLDLASAYAVFAAQGVRYGAQLPAGETPDGAPAPGMTVGPTAALRVEGLDHSLWLDLSNPQAQPVVTPALAYLMNSALTDEAARWPTLGHPNELEIGRPVGVKLGRSGDGEDTWGIGYTPSLLVAVWQRASASPISATRPPSVALLASVLQIATQGQPSDSWSMPAGVTTMQVCDPSGLLPTRDCPTTVSEVFLSGNEPAQADTLFRRFTVNRETGLLATVFTPPELVEDKVFMVVPPEAQEWARSANLAFAPASYDAIQAPPVDPNVHISTPAIFAEVSGKVQFRGTASGADFDHYRLLVGQGLNPQSWIVVADSAGRVEDGLLGTWDTAGLSGLYAVELQVLRTDKRLDTAITQVTVK